MAKLKSMRVMKLFSLFLTILGVVLLAIEIYHWTVLPSMYNEEGIYSLITLFKYKENSYSQMFICAMVVVTGISFWLGNKINWLVYQAILVSACLILLIHLYLSFLPLIFKLVILALILSIVFLLQKQLYRYQVVKEIKKPTRVGSIIIGLLSSIVYVLIFGYYG